MSALVDTSALIDHLRGGVDRADLAVAAAAVRLGLRLLARDVRHCPMFADLRAPY